MERAYCHQEDTSPGSMLLLWISRWNSIPVCPGLHALAAARTAKQTFVFVIKWLERKYPNNTESLSCKTFTYRTKYNTKNLKENLWFIRSRNKLFRSYDRSSRLTFIYLKKTWLFSDNGLRDRHLLFMKRLKNGYVCHLGQPSDEFKCSLFLYLTGGQWLPLFVQLSAVHDFVRVELGYPTHHVMSLPPLALLLDMRLALLVFVILLRFWGTKWKNYF